MAVSREYSELRVERLVTNYLSNKYELYPYQAVFTYCFNDWNGTLGFTFLNSRDLNRFLEDVLDYSILCDKTGIIVYSESNSVILTSTALFTFFTKIEII